MENIDPLFVQLHQYIKRNFVSTSRPRYGKFCYSMKPAVCQEPHSFLSETGISSRKIDSWIENKELPPFREILFGHIDMKWGGNDAEVYKRAGMDRKLFSKIRTMPNYVPNKTNVIALILALRLDQEEADALMAAAGYCLSFNRRFDLVIRFCIENRIYELIKVNTLLHQMGMKTVY